MADRMKVDPGRLREASRFVAGKAQAMRERLKQLDDTIGKRLLSEGWDGRAAGPTTARGPIGNTAPTPSSPPWTIRPPSSPTPPTPTKPKTIDGRSRFIIRA
jgi:hypothetical protein